MTFAFVILVLHLPAVEEAAEVAADQQADVTHLDGDLFHSVGGLGRSPGPAGAEHLQAPGDDALRMAPYSGATHERVAQVTGRSPARRSQHRRPLPVA